MDTASCPIVAGTPEVLKARSPRRVDFFADARHQYVDHALTFTEPLLKQQMFAVGSAPRDDRGRERLRRRARHKAMDKFDEEIQEQGQEILGQVEKRIASRC
jgi:predicted nucleotide-binding protein (sugar kinase/HSP70/actin superfamily)